ncbi:hypothetical protein BJ508DRAFT_343381 [Ascobolus immersus RN42]|uniref:Uncharacterized protein n=1 Tax=Ascobolus immersus RN42 TaxID=1160509 RepID=A0A3N4HHS1_ASCIM|nr:hypothetical protein BJ508DRAFT_343381 [Ascobolus immersus RN42]
MWRQWTGTGSRLYQDVLQLLVDSIPVVISDTGQLQSNNFTLRGLSNIRSPDNRQYNLKSAETSPKDMAKSISSGNWFISRFGQQLVGLLERGYRILQIQSSTLPSLLSLATTPKEDLSFRRTRSRNTTILSTRPDAYLSYREDERHDMSRHVQTDEPIWERGDESPTAPPLANFTGPGHPVILSPPIRSEALANPIELVKELEQHKEEVHRFSFKPAETNLERALSKRGANPVDQEGRDKGCNPMAWGGNESALHAQDHLQDVPQRGNFSLPEPEKAAHNTIQDVPFDSPMEETDDAVQQPDNHCFRCIFFPPKQPFEIVAYQCEFSTSSMAELAVHRYNVHHKSGQAFLCIAPLLEGGRLCERDFGTDSLASFIRHLIGSTLHKHPVYHDADLPEPVVVRSKDGHSDTFLCRHKKCPDRYKGAPRKFSSEESYYDHWKRYFYCGMAKGCYNGISAAIGTQNEGPEETSHHALGEMIDSHADPGNDPKGNDASCNSHLSEGRNFLQHLKDIHRLDYSKPEIEPLVWLGLVEEYSDKWLRYWMNLSAA